MSNLVPEGASPCRPPRTKDILDRDSGRVIGRQTQRVYLLAVVPNARLRHLEPDGFEFNAESEYDGNTIPPHFRGRFRTVDVFLQAGIQPAEELTGRVEVKAFVTENLFSARATGEDEIRQDSENDYLRITFVGPADETHEEQLLAVLFNEPKDATYDDAFGWTKKDAGVFIGIKPIQKVEAPFNQVLSANDAAKASAAS